MAHIRFRAAWKYNGRTLDEIPFKAALGVYGSWCGVILVILVLIAQVSNVNLSFSRQLRLTKPQFYVAVWPIGGLNGKPTNDAEGFFKVYLALPVVLFFWVCGYFWKRTGFLKVSQIDIDSGRRPIDWEAHHALLEKKRNAPLWKRFGYFLF